MAIDWLGKLRSMAQTASGVLQDAARQAEGRDRDETRRNQDAADQANLARRAAQLTGRSAVAGAFGQQSNSARRPDQADSVRPSAIGDPSARLSAILQERSAMAERLKKVEDAANAEIKRRVDGRQGSDYHKAYTAAANEFWAPVTRLRHEKQERDRVCDREEAALLKTLPPSSGLQALADLILMPEGGFRFGSYLTAEYKQSLRALSPERRGELFDVIDLAQRTLNWGDAPIKCVTHMLPIWSVSRIGVGAELVRAELLQGGFEMTPERAILALSMLANEKTALRIKRWATDKYTAKQNLHAIRDIERAVKKGLFDLPDTAREDAGRIVELMGEDRYNRGGRGGPERTDVPVIKTLRVLAGTGQQQNFYQRVKDYPATQFPNLQLIMPTPEKATFWDDVLVEFGMMHDDFMRARSGIREANWLFDRRLFDEKFGPHDGKGVFSFGWWTRDTKGEEGFDKDYNSYASKVFAGQSEFADKAVMTPAYTAELREQAKTVAKDWPYLHSGPGVPFIKLFELDGNDPQGALISHLATAADGPPTATWLKETDKALNAAGSESALDAFKSWAASLFVFTMPEVDEQLFSDLSRYSSAFSQHGVRYWPAELPAEGTEAYRLAVRQSALKVLLAPGYAFRAAPGNTARWKSSSYQIYSSPSENNLAVIRGIALALSRYPSAQATPLLEEMAAKMIVRDDRGRQYIRADKGFATCIWSLGETGTREAAEALGRLRRKTADKKAIAAINRALAKAGDELGLPVDEMQELAMADWGIGDDGVRIEQLGELMAELRVTSSKKAELRTIDAKGKSSRGISKAFKALEGGTEIAAELEEAVKDIAEILPEARRRLERSWREARSWTYAGWQDRIMGNGLLRMLAERLIWRFEGPDGTSFVAIPNRGALLDHNAAPCPQPDDGWTVHLWHPLDSDSKTVEAWRTHLIGRRIRQPIIQAWRPIYVLTEAELNTRTYSNRFAAHVLEQAPAMAMLKSRGWQAFNRTMQGNSAEHERVRVILPHYKVATEYWVSGVGTRIQDGKAAEAGGELYAFIATDRVTFYALDAKGQKPEGEPIPVNAVPARAFTEILYDIDTIVGRTSIGNDRHWQDGGANARHPVSENVQFVGYRDRYSSGKSSELANARRAVIKSLLPSMAIAEQCSIGDDHLIVDGKLNSYKIHFGSSNIRIMPNDQYLCIVPKREASERVSYVPFEGDEILSVILSKAIMLVDDDKIEDASILHQLRRIKAA
ncbi:MAG: DUF4132 domain-containing protein [Rhizobiaceae bacterium]